MCDSIGKMRDKKDNNLEHATIRASRGSVKNPTTDSSPVRAPISDKRRKGNNKAANRYYYRNKEKILAKQYEYKNRPEVTQHRLSDPKRVLTRVRRRAVEAKVDFNLTVEDIIIPDECPILGIPLDRRDRNHAPSADRVDPTKGYIKGNVRFISMQANRLKSNATAEDLEKILKYVKGEL